MSSWPVFAPSEPTLPLAAFGIAFLTAWLLTALLRRWAPHVRLVDLPSARKVHLQPTPKGGGLAIYLALLLTLALLPQGRGGDTDSILLLGGAIVLLGLVDDLRPLPWQGRLGVQTLAALVVVFGWPSDVGWMYRAAAVFWIVGLINAFNMLDNMDALSGGVAWIAAGIFALALLIGQDGTWDWQPVVPFLALMGALTGFLWFNLPPARIFMGDAGSTFLGFFLGVRSLGGSFSAAGGAQTWLLPLCVLAVPWYDLTSVVALRLWQGHSPFHADKQHLSHRLVKLGLSSPRAVRVIYLLGLVSGLAGLLILHVPATFRPWVGGQLLIYWSAIAAIEYVGHFRSSGKESP